MMMTALRMAALAIAILAVADPAVTSSRSSRPLVAVVSADPVKDGALVNRVVHMLERDFTVVRGSIGAAAGTVLVGSAVPDESRSPGASLVAVLPAQAFPSVRIAALEAPATSQLNARVPVDVTVSAYGARGRRLSVVLNTGDVVVGRASQVIDADSAALRATVFQVPQVAGPAVLTVTASVDGTSAADSASTVIDARDERLPVLFFDTRASWLSTFVRRAVERDARFAVTHRVVTSRGVSNTAGVAPGSLRDLQSLADFPTVVVGAPEQLSEGDVAGLDAFMRRRGGRVVLLMDRRAGGPVDRLTGIGNWRATRLPAAASFGTPDGNAVLRGQEIAWPAATPDGATTHVIHVARDSTRRSLIWSVPVGAGRLLVNGTLDTWHHRDPVSSGFDAFWSATIADLSAAPRSIDVSLSPRALIPGQAGAIRVKLRDVLLSNSDSRSASVSATLVVGNDSTMVRLWPDATPGVFVGRIVAPRQPGTYRLTVSAGTESAEASLVVDQAARAVARDDRLLIEAFVSSRGGTVVPEADLRQLPGRLSSALQTVSRVETWYPMRSAWWIMPFTLLLGAEWWWRRRRGLT